MNKKQIDIAADATSAGVKVTVEPIDKIRFKKTNPREHSAQNLKLIGKSINDHKTGRSILIDENNETIAGQGTTTAARKQGIKDVVVIEVTGDQLVAVKRTGLSEQAKRELAILDNSTTDTSEWDFKALQSNLLALREAGKDLTELGFTGEEIDIFTQSDFTKKVVIDGDDAHERFAESLETVFKFTHAEMKSVLEYAELLKLSPKAAIIEAIKFSLDKQKP